MPRRHKNKRRKVTIDNTSMMFYPLYSGRREDKIPIFRYASEALSWQISRYFKDAICHSWGDDSYPIWLSFVGGVQDDTSLYNNIQRTYTSDVEKQYFKATKFFDVTSVDHDFPTLIFDCSQEMFTNCRSTFHSHPDYQSSSKSIYRSKAKCLQVTGGCKGTKTWDFIPRQRGHNNLISIGSTTVVKEVCLGNYKMLCSLTY